MQRQRAQASSMLTQCIWLPWPPSVNAMWRSVQGRNILSAPGRAYRKAAIQYIKLQGIKSYKAEQRLFVSLVLYPPDKRRRDVDNWSKAPLDACTAAGVWADDSQIDHLTIARGSPAGHEAHMLLTVTGGYCGAR